MKNNYKKILELIDSDGILDDSLHYTIWKFCGKAEAHRLDQLFGKDNVTASDPITAIKLNILLLMMESVEPELTFQDLRDKVINFQ